MGYKKYKEVVFKVPVEHAELFEREANVMLENYKTGNFSEVRKYIPLYEALGLRFEEGIHVYTTDLKETEKKFNDMVEKLHPETVGDRMVKLMDNYNRAELKVLQQQGKDSRHLKWFWDAIENIKKE